MKKLIILLAMCVMVFCTSCDRSKPVLLFSPSEIEYGHFGFQDAKTDFDAGKKIYFVVYNPKPFTSDIMRLQTLKLDLKAPSYGITLVQGRDIEIDKSMPYFTGSFVVYAPGYYMLRVFSRDNFNLPLVESGFNVK